MSRLSEMIQELCPDGVEYRKLGEIAEIVRGNGLQKKDFVDSGVGCIHYGQIYTKFGAFADKTLTYVTPELAATLKKVSTGDLVVAITSENVEDVCKCVAWLGNGDIVTGGHAAIVKHEQNPQYLSYIFQTEEFFRQKRKYIIGTKVIEMSPKKLAEIVIPVPPLPIQNEIVKMLDNFTELTAELTAEHSLRKKQYNFYRDSLLNFSRDDTAVTYEGGDEVSWYLTGDIFNLQNGYTPSKKQPSYWENGTIPWYRMEDIRTNGRILYDAIQHIHPSGVKSSLYPANSLLMATTATIGEYALLMKSSLSNQQMTNFSIKEEFQEILNIKFAFYYFHVFAVWCKKNANQSGGMPIITVAKLKTFSFPIPPLDVQKKIVSILDRFDALCNDLTQGLPAEIAARKKQYEYYRDKLLTFPRKAV